MLGERLQYLRLEKGMTQKELSKVFKVSLKTIQFYEQNRTIPDIYLVAEMAKFFNVSCDYILGVVNTPIPLDEREAEEFRRSVDFEYDAECSRKEKQLTATDVGKFAFDALKDYKTKNEMGESFKRVVEEHRRGDKEKNDKSKNNAKSL